MEGGETISIGHDQLDSLSLPEMVLIVIQAHNIQSPGQVFY